MKTNILFWWTDKNKTLPKSKILRFVLFRGLIRRTLNEDPMLTFTLLIPNVHVCLWHKLLRPPEICKSQNLSLLCIEWSRSELNYLLLTIPHHVHSFAKQSLLCIKGIYSFLLLFVSRYHVRNFKSVFPTGKEIICLSPFLI